MRSIRPRFFRQERERQVVEEERRRRMEEERIRQKERERIAEEERIRREEREKAAAELEEKRGFQDLTDVEDDLPFEQPTTITAFYKVVATPEEIEKVEMAFNSIGIYFERRDT